MSPRHQPERARAFQELGKAPFDLAIVGGGITGCGVARDAARRGLRVALIEKGDIAGGTSGRSSRLIHGGLRYLEQGKVGLVLESIREREILTHLAPHLTRPLPFLVPIYADSRRGRLALETGLWIHEALGRFRHRPRHRSLDAIETLECEPNLLRDGLRGAIVYHDYATDDARLTLETALGAVSDGAKVVTQARALRLLDVDGQITGIRVRDEIGSAEVDLLAHLTVVATGPWLDETLGDTVEGKARLLRPTRGVHIVVPADRLPVSHAVTVLHPQHRQVAFLIPWNGFTYVGTTDTDHNGDPDRVVAEASDVAELLATVEHYFPESHLQSADVVSTWAGLRPLFREDGKHESDVNREHRILEPRLGLLAVAGGKLTTYRSMAAEIVDRAYSLLGGDGAPPSATAEAPLPGAPSWSWEERLDSPEAESLRTQHGLPPEAVDHLVSTYGSRALEAVGRDPDGPIAESLPHRWAEIDFAIEKEMALRLDDVLIRRTQLFHRAPDQALDLARPVALRMADRLGWSDHRIEEEVSRYRDLVEASRIHSLPSTEVAGG